MKSVKSEIFLNRVKTSLLFVVFIAFMIVVLAAVLYLFTGSMNPRALGIGVLIALAVMLGYYFLSSKVALSLNKAREVSRQDAPDLYNMVEALARQIDMPMPKVYIMDHEMQMNAFATGRGPKDGHIAFTRGILEGLTYEELKGVAAHELAHVRNEDIKIMTLAAGLAMIIGSVVSIASHAIWFRDKRSVNPLVMIIGLVVLSILAPLAAGLVQASISRNREALADASAVEHTSNPAGLMNALRKISGGSQVSTAKEATAHMFFSNPLSKTGSKQMLNKLFSTHPPIEDRIRKLDSYR